MKPKLIIMMILNLIGMSCAVGSVKESIPITFEIGIGKLDFEMSELISSIRDCDKEELERYPESARLDPILDSEKKVTLVKVPVNGYNFSFNGLRILDQPISDEVKSLESDSSIEALTAYAGISLSTRVDDKERRWNSVCEGVKIKIEGDYYSKDRNHYLIVSTWTEDDKPFKIGTTLEFERDSEGDYTQIIPSVQDMHSESRVRELVMTANNLQMAKSGFTGYTDISRYYYIITPAKFIDSAKEIALWKSQKGYQVTVKSVEDILSDPKYTIDVNKIRDEAECIKAYLRDEYAKNNTFYLLLIGNSTTSMPIRKTYYQYYENPEWHDNNYCSQSFIPNDWYFASVNTTTPLVEMNGHLVATSSYSASADMLRVGRLLINNNQKLDNYIKKLRLYEAFPGRGDGEYLLKGLVTKQYDLLTHTTIFDKLSHIDDVTELRDNEASSFEEAFPKGADAIKELRNVGLAHLLGHGSPNSIGLHGKRLQSWLWRYLQSNSRLSNVDIHISTETHEIGNGLDLLDNYPRPGIVAATSCSTSPFDILCSPGFVYDFRTNMAQSYTVDGLYGGVVWIGGTRDMWTSWKIATQLGENISLFKNIGDAFIESFSTISPEYQKRNIIGDPEVTVWLHNPENSRFNSRLSGGTLWFENPAISGSFISIYDGNNSKCVWVGDGHTNSFTLIPSDFNKKDPKGCSNNDFLIGIWSHSYLPTLKLFADNKTLAYTTRKYLLRDCTLNRNSNFPCYYTIENFGELHLNCLDRLDSDNGLYIRNEGRVILESDSTVSLANDKVEAGGELLIEAKEVVLKNGFTVEKGALVKVNTSYTK